jgi:hypothetical protein
MQDTRYYAWNFVNLIAFAGTGSTIEWRMPPGVTTAEECFMWVELGVGFIQAARKPDTEAVLRSDAYEVCLGGLKRFIVERGALPGSDRGFLDMVFARAGLE